MKPYTHYPLHERINRKSYFGTLPYKMKHIIYCTEKPEMFMQEMYLKNESPRRYLNGETVNETANIVYYKLMPNGTTL